MMKPCSEQTGSRLIQAFFETASDQEKEAMFKSIKPWSRNLMKNKFGNFAMQWIIKFGTDSIQEEAF